MTAAQIPKLNTIVLAIILYISNLSTKAFIPHQNQNVFFAKHESKIQTLKQTNLQELPPQSRRKIKQRHARNYWSNISNFRKEIMDFWSTLNVPLGNKVPIPNETLLNYYNRHDLRSAIYSLGGRNYICTYLSREFYIIPGKWKDAIKCKEVQHLLNRSNDNCYGLLEKDIPPLAPHVYKKLVQSDDMHRFKNGKRWVHTIERHPYGYWDKDLLLSEL